MEVKIITEPAWLEQVVYYLMGCGFTFVLVTIYRCFVLLSDWIHEDETKSLRFDEPPLYDLMKKSEKENT